MRPGYIGDMDIDHVIEENRKLYVDGHVDIIEEDVPMVHDTPIISATHDRDYHLTDLE